MISRLTSCDLTYGPTHNPNQTHVISQFLPQHRTFNIHPLEESTSYWFTLLCQDMSGQGHSSKTVYFTTGKVGYCKLAFNIMFECSPLLSPQTPTCSQGGGRAT